MKVTLVSLLLLLSSLACEASECELSMRVTDSYPRFYNTEEKWHGMQIELAHALAHEAKCKISFKSMSWDRALKELQSGTLDMMGEMSITSARREYLHFIGPQASEKMVLVVRKNTDYLINSLDDLKKIPGKFGLARNSWYGSAMQIKLNSDPDFVKKIEFVLSDHIQLERIKLGRLYGYVTMQYPATYRIKSNTEYNQKLKIHDFIINDSWVYWGLSKVSIDPAMLSRLSAAYERLKQSGQLGKILAQYQ